MSEAIAIAFALPAALLALQVVQTLYWRLRTYAIMRCVAQLSDMIVATEEPTDAQMRAMRWRYPMGVLLDSVRFVAERVYGGALNRLALVVEVCEIDHLMLCKILRRRGAHRTSQFWKLTNLPYAAAVVEYVEGFVVMGTDADFCAMAALVSSHPDRAMQYIARYTPPLSLYEVAVLVAYLRRIGTSIAYTPLLTSTNRNLQMIGIYVSHHFEIADAEPHLQRLVESEDEEVAYLALLTICTIRGDISARRVGVALSRLRPHQRNAFLLRAVQCCYSLRACAHHLSREERTRFTQRQNSYKCKIVCN